MKIHEKIQQIRKEKKLTQIDVIQNIRKIFGEKTITDRTLQNIEAGKRAIKTSSLYQLCLGMGITLEELKQGTEDAAIEYTKKKNRDNRYPFYGYNSCAEIISSLKDPFLMLHMILAPGSKTPIEKDPTGTIEYKKCVFCLVRTLDFIIGDKKYVLHKGDSLSFDSRTIHSFENPYKFETQAVIVHYPGRL